RRRGGGAGSPRGRRQTTHARGPGGGNTTRRPERTPNPLPWPEGDRPMVPPPTPERKPADWPAGRPSLPPDSGWPLISAADLPADMLLPRLIGVREVGPGQWSACCPAHADGRPSLSISETDDFRLLVYCHAGFDIDDVMAEVGLQVCTLFPSDYARLKAVQAGTRKSPALGGAQRGKPVELSAPAHVIESLTAHARACHETAAAGGRL